MLFRRSLPVAFTLVFCLTGCGSPKAQTQKLEPVLSEARIEPPPVERRLEDLPVLQVEEEAKKPKPERLYTLSMRKAKIKDVLLSFARESNINIIVDPDVEGEVTLDLKDVTLQQALDALLTPLSIEYKRQSGFIRVSRPKTITRLFHLNYISTQRSGFRGMTSSSGGAFGAGGGGLGGFGAGGAGLGGIGGIGGITGGVTGAVPPTGAAPGQAGVGFGGGGFDSVQGSDVQDIYRELELGLTALGLRSVGALRAAFGVAGGIGAGAAPGAPAEAAPAGAVPGQNVFSINRQAGIILVAAFPDILAKAAELIEAVEGTIQRQVHISARIVEVALKDEFRFGINWDLVFGLHRRRDTAIGFGADEAERKLVGGGLIRDIKRVEGLIQFTLRTGDFTTIMEALQRQGDVNVISSPKVSTLNNQTAIIRVGTQETFFSTRVTTTAGITPIQQKEDVQTPVTIGVTLDVTPQISSAGVITMNIHPSITDKLTTTKNPVTGAEAPVLNIRETDTVIRVRDGETIVIGGLMQEKVDATEEGTPGLGKIPIVGRLFKETKREKRKTDLVIFLTPTVLIGDRIEDLSTEELERLELSRSFGTMPR